ncbi:MAG: hypothetical protein B7Z68_07760 [Acidobacteria bacterium 21-70-11]|nr:MAG: hypothetical protein B7Z68_07760 [Acidobacteria bacterium 21-70-11]
MALLLAEVLTLLAQRVGLRLQRRLLRGQRVAPQAGGPELLVPRGELRAQRGQRLRGRVPLPLQRRAAGQQPLQRNVPCKLVPRRQRPSRLSSTPNPT